jgi:hypothetical protein
MMIKVFDTILSDIESEIISEDLKRRNLKWNVMNVIAQNLCSTIVQNLLTVH